MLYLIAYDIADPARLRRVARALERHALRCQKSVFLFHGDVPAVVALLDLAATLMDLAQDIIQAWRLSTAEAGAALARGNPLNITPPAVVLAGGERFLLSPETSDSENGSP